MSDHLYAGIDLHKTYSFICLKDQQGKQVKQQRIPNKDDAFIDFFAPFKDHFIKAVVEATSNYYWLFETLESIGIKVVLAHPLKVKAIAEAKIKSDKIDAGILADLLRVNMIPESYIPPQEIRYLRELVRHRIRLVRRKSKLKISLRDILTKAHFPDCFADITGKTARSHIQEYKLPLIFRMQCDNTLDQIDCLEKLIDKVGRTIKSTAVDSDAAQRLKKIRGIADFSALVILSEIGRVQRFNSAKKLVRYAGLCPGLHQSGNKKYHTSIVKEGSRYLRWILCEVVWHAIRVPGPLRDFFFSLRKTKGTQKAVIATARKMLVGIYYVLRDGAEFKPIRNKRYAV